MQLTRGVAAAHALKIVHRDLKPENLCLTRDGTLRILDFGLAKLRPGVVAGPETATRESSMGGGLVGTPAYMAPEQLRGEPVDHRADLLAIGAILYEMVTGGSPFRKPSGAEMIAAILREAPAALETGPGFPPGLGRLILHCLEKDPWNRFQAAAEGGPPAVRPGPGSPRSVSSIAVLPFTDMSPTRDQDYLCEGMAEEGLRVTVQPSPPPCAGA